MPPLSGTGSEFWHGRNVLVTGGAGFIGSSVVRALNRRGVPGSSIVIPRSATCDLRRADSCRRAVEGCSVVIHLAAPTGGIAFSRSHPASQYRDCSLINVNMLDAARETGVERFVGVGNLLAYPERAPSPLREQSVHDGRIAATHVGIGLAKRDLLSLAEMYLSEYGLHVTNVLSANAYGPGDRFDPQYGHVIPSTIQKCFQAEDLVVWGDGSPTRDFLFVDDVAEGILLAAERLGSPDYVNIASGSEISIAELVGLIAELCGFRGRIVFDATKGGGDPRRVAATAKATELLGFTPAVSLRQGLARTIEWFRRQHEPAAQ